MQYNSVKRFQWPNKVDELSNQPTNQPTKYAHTHRLTRKRTHTDAQKQAYIK